MNGRRIALAVAVLLAAAACQPEVRTEVLIVGDSITVAASDEIVSTFNGVEADQYRYLPAIAAHGGQGLTFVGNNVPPNQVDAFWSAHVRSLIEQGHPGTIVVGLGVNDCSQFPGPTTADNLAFYGAKIDNFMAQVPAETMLRWTTIPDPRRKVCDVTLNTALRDADARWENLTLLPWAALANLHPEWFDEDGIHQTAEGQRAYAAFLKDQLDRT